MVIKIGFTRKLFKSLMYKDRMEVYRLGLTMGEDFTVSNEQSVQPIYTKIPCKISLNYQDLPEEDSVAVTAQGLVSLGYSRSEAMMAIKKVENAAEYSPEQLLKKALTKLI